MKRIFLFMMILPSMSLAGFGPTWLQCNSVGKIQVTYKQKKKMYSPGFNKLRISEVPVLAIMDKNKAVAKLYPQAGLESALLSKKYKIETDEHNYWNLIRLPNTSLVSCELIND